LKGHNRQPKISIANAEKVSPPFEGGVAGTIDYLIFTKLISRPGWLIYSFSAEAALWKMLKSKKLEGRKFIRQYLYSELHC